MKHPDQFVNTMTEKMLTYALGRGLEYYDMPVVRSNREGLREKQLSIYDAGHGYREKHAVSDEDEELGESHVHYEEASFPPDIPACRRRDSGIAVPGLAWFPR